MLPGIMPAIGSLLTLAFRASSVSDASANITLPSTVQAGDLIVLVDRTTAGGSAPTKVIPTGFTEIRSDSANTGTTFIRVTYSYKIADGSDASAVVTGQTSPNTRTKIALVFSGNRPISAVNVGFSDAQITDGDPTAIVVTSGGGAAPLVVFGGYAGSNVSPRTMSPAKDAEVNSTANHYLAYKIYNTSPADVTVDMDDEGVLNGLAGFYISAS